MVEEFAASIRGGRSPRTDGTAGLRILDVLEAAGRSLRQAGELQPLAPSGWRHPAVAVAG